MDPRLTSATSFEYLIEPQEEVDLEIVFHIKTLFGMLDCCSGTF
jgi:hypothetical protein